MNKPEQFIVTSDYATLKNDATGAVSVTFPGSQSIASNQLRTYTNTATLGTRGASLRTRIMSSKHGSWYSCSTLSFSRNANMGGMTVPYSISAFVTRTQPDEVTVIVSVLNPYDTSITTASGNETFTFELSTFLSPFG